MNASLLNPKAFRSLVSFLIIIFSIGNANAQLQWAQKGADIDGEAADDFSGYSISLSADGSIVAIGAPWNDGNGIVSGHVRVYRYAAGTWTQMGSDIDGEASEDNSGASVSLSDDGYTVAIGAPLNDGNGINAGHTRIFSYSEGDWVQLGNDIDGRAASDQSGYSVSLSADGTMVAIGAVQNDNLFTYPGYVMIYHYSEGAWVQLGSDIIGETAGDFFGHSVSLSGNGMAVAIGAPYNDDSGFEAGHMRLYEFKEGDWAQMGEDIDGEFAGDNSGWFVSMSKDGMVVANCSFKSDAGGDNSGKVRVYRNSEGSWPRLGNDLVGNAGGDYFGMSISLSSDGSRIALGGVNDDSFRVAGRTVVYEYGDGIWTQLGENINGENEGDFSGYSVSMNSDGTIVASGAIYNSGTGINSGHVRVYNLCSPVYSTDVQTACEYFVWIDGNEYTENNNTATFVLTGSSGCDSIVTLDLTIIYTDASVVQAGATLTANAAGAEYQWLDCNNLNEEISGATNQSFTATQNGSYSVLVTQNGCQALSDCYNVTGLGVSINTFENKILVYPNPSDGIINIDLGKEYRELRVVVRDISGKTVLDSNYKSTKNISFGLDTPAGIYFIEISSEKEKGIFRLIRQ